MSGLELKRRTDGSIGLMGHVIADFPNPRLVRDMISTMVDHGVEVIEIQIPFSEPMADGPVFLAANHQALAAGVDYSASMRLMEEVTGVHAGAQFVFMSYLNIPYKRGYDRFCAEAAAAGARGVIVADLPFHADMGFHESCEKAGLTHVELIPPNCRGKRLEAICKRSSGMVYAVARKGVTGAGTDFSSGIRDLVSKIRSHTKTPVAVGFGVRSGDDVKALRGTADFAIVGTASLQAFQAGGLAGFSDFWKWISQGAGV